MANKKIIKKNTKAFSFKNQKPIIKEDFVPESPKVGLFDFLNDVYYAKKGNLLNEVSIKDYSPFMINKFMFGNIDTLYYAQELNQFGNITKEEHYKYLIHALPKKKRFSKFLKEKKDHDIELVQEYYKCSYIKAKETIKLLNSSQLNHIKLYLNKGG